MKNVLIPAIICLCFSTPIFARQGVPPVSQEMFFTELTDVMEFTTPEIDPIALKAEDKTKSDPGPLRFASPIVTDIDPETFGTWETLGDGSRLWRLQINCPGSTDLNFGFSRFWLPDGATFYILSGQDSYYQGPYTFEDNRDDSQFWSPLVPGDTAVLELHIPTEVTEDPILLLSQIGRGYRDMFKQTQEQKSGSCNNDVICPEGDPWRDEIRSVAVYSLNGFLSCTGTLVMDTSGSYTPYFLTADHCGISVGNAASMVVYWNFESPSCGQLGGGSLDQSQDGATFRASRTDVDMCLVELNEMPLEEFNVYYSGWDRSDNVPNGSVGIHHPNTDEKAISFNDDPLSTIDNCIETGTDTHWEVDNWEDGTTEPGSSGSGLWDPDNHKLVGFLSGGNASCSFPEGMDCYGKFSVAWDGPDASQRLKDWLDPQNTDVLVIDGANPGGVISTDVTPPSPDPMEWEVEPVAVGLETIYMRAVTAEDESGVEYFFDCVNVPADNDPNYDSGWQDSPVYYRGGYEEGTTYQFRVKARDKSSVRNETEYSVIEETTTALTTDTLPPAVSPAQWKGTPRKVSNDRLAMEAVEGYDEFGTQVEYYFKCISTTDTNFPNPSDLDSEWQTSPLYTVPGVSVGTPGNIYVFQVQMRDAVGIETGWSEDGKAILAPPARVLEVPYPYYTIQEAIDFANHGDTVVVHPGTYSGLGNINLDFMGKAITVRSEDPENPAVVAATIIDCGGTTAADFSHDEMRAFIFMHDEERDSVVDGLTIINGFAVNNPANAANPSPTEDPNGLDAMGGAIYCADGTSPSITNCVIRDCFAFGGYGIDGFTDDPGADGPDGAGDDTDGTDGGPGIDGGQAGVGGHGFGGAIYCEPNCAPLIQECTINNCFAIGGNGGRGGDGSDGGNGGAGGGGDSSGGAGGHAGHGGDAGHGGNSAGGAIYFGENCKPEIVDCVISNCISLIGMGGAGGHGGSGGHGGDGTGTGNGGDAGDGGNGGHGGHDGGGLEDLEYFAYAGAIFTGSMTELNLSGTIIEGNVSTVDREDRTEERYNGGNGGDGGNGGGSDQDGTDGLGGFGGHGGNNGGILATIAEVYGAGGDAGDGGDGSVGGDGGFGGNGSPSGNAGQGGSVGGFPGERGNAADIPPFVHTYGGAIFADDFSSITAIDSTLRNNLCPSDDGGGIFFNMGNDSEFTDCVFQGNEAIDDGGAICLDDPNFASFTGCVFNGNLCGNTQSGGAIGYQEGGSSGILIVDDCEFTDNGNDQAYWGGGIWAEFGTLEIYIKNSVFTGNKAIYGAAISVHAIPKVVCETSVFTSNTGEFGGAVYASEVDLTIEGSRFIGNLAQPLLGSLNVACSGGALYCGNSSLRSINNVFVENDAQLTGGAIYLIGPYYYIPDGTQDIVNCLMAENTAGVNGGAVSVMNGAEPYMINCTMASNEATGSFSYGGAVSCGYDSLSGNDETFLYTYALLENCILWDNDAGFGAQAALGDPLDLENQLITLEVSHSDIQGGIEDIYLGAPIGNTWVFNDGGVINEDPLFVDISNSGNAEDRTFYLSQVDPDGVEPLQSILDFETGLNNPCVDTGVGTVADLAALLGFDVTTRTDHGTETEPVDMGYHYDASQPIKEFVLQTSVYVADRFPHGTLYVTSDPNNHILGDPPTLENESLTTYKYKQGTIVGLSAEPEEYYRVARWIGTDEVLDYYDPDNTVTMTGFENVQVEFELAVPKNLYVPGSYPTIEEAVIASRTGDRIILDPRPTQPYLISEEDGINFGGKDLLVTSLDPNDPAIVASTIIDCQGSRYLSKRAFHFESGESSDSIIQGITIRNGFKAVIGESAVLGTFLWPFDLDWLDSMPSPPPPSRAPSGADGSGDSYGGAILVENDSSPIIRNCVFENCTVTGGIGGDGADGNYPVGMINITADLDSQSGGHSGKGTGDGYGGAIAVLTGSNPKILKCTFENNRATGGWGGRPGDAGYSYNNGRYGWGGNDPAGLAFASFFFGINPQAGYGEGDGHGGAIYVGVNCDPIISQCIFEGNYIGSGEVYPGGMESPGGEEYPESFDADPWANPFMRQGRDGFLITTEDNAGGAVFFAQDANSMLDECTFTTNTAPIGGAVYADPNVVLKIQDCEFSGQIGGAVYMDTEADLEILNSQFYDNDANQLPEVGGAVTIGVDAIDASISESRFVGNSTQDSGGAILTFSDIVVEDSIFKENTASADGGAFYAYYHIPDPNTHTVQLDFTNCEFVSNEALGLGGAGFAKNTVLTMTDCPLVLNTAVSGGALRVPISDLTMQGCLIVGNEATGTDNGSEGYGGGIHVIDSSFDISNCRFEVNSSSGNTSAGGGLCVTGGQVYLDRILRNCLFGRNRTKGTGGGIACLQYIDLVIENSTIADNVSVRNRGGGIYLDYESNVDIKDSIVSGNVGFGIYEKRPNCESKADYTLFYGNQTGDLYDAQTMQPVSGAADLMATAGYTNVLDSNPAHAFGPWGAYYLNQGQSTAVDAGSESAVEAMLDIFTTDPAEALDQGVVDLGYHYDLAVGSPQFTLTASVVNDRHGSIMTPGHETYLRYAVVPVEAIPDPNYRVVYWDGTDDDGSRHLLNGAIMLMDRVVRVEFEGSGPKFRYVPDGYPTIEEAVDASYSGDTIIIAPRPGEVYLISDPDGINFYGRQIHLRSTDPNNPEVVENTVLDLRGNRYNSKRAFHFNNGENPDTIIEGITIANAFTAIIGPSAILDTGLWPWHDGFLFGVPPEPWDQTAPDPDPLPPLRAPSGMDSIGDSYGGAILCDNGSSPTIRKCIFKKCTVAGGIGGDGADGAYPAGMRDVTEDLDAQSGGHSGKGVGNGYGGAIAVIEGSNPQIYQCEFIENRATGGWGGIPGNAGVAYNNGRYAWGGNDWAGLAHLIINEIPGNDWENAGNGEGDGRGGAIYVDEGCDPLIWKCTFEGNYARPGYVNDGGSQSPNGSPYPEPFDLARPPVAWGAADARKGNAGVLTDYGTLAGGAVFFAENADGRLDECTFEGNNAYDVFTFNDPPDYTRGGAVHMDPNVILEIYNCDFVENFAGALYSSTEGSLVVEDSSFVNNSSYDPGAEIDPALEFLLLLEEGIPLLPEEEETTDPSGGITIEVDNKVPAQIQKSRFIGNSTKGFGGALATSGDIVVTDSLFNANMSSEDGGAFYSYYDIPDSNNWHTVSLDFFNCEFSGNESEGLGGAGYVRTAVLDVNDCFFMENTGFSGGGIYAAFSDVLLDRTLMYGNEAIGLVEGQYRTIENEGFGGGLMTVDSEVKVIDSRFLENKVHGANSCGGAVCLTGGQIFREITLRNCLIADNESDNAGGGISCKMQMSVNINNCTVADNISGNQRGGGIFVDNTSEAILENSIVSGNEGYGIYESPTLGGGGSSYASYSLFYDNQSADLFDAVTNQDVSGVIALRDIGGYGVSGKEDILDDNPRYKTGPLNGYYLDQDNASPAIDAGSDFPINVNLFDVTRRVRYTTDPTDPRDDTVIEDGGSNGISDLVDLGYHYFIPDPDTDLYSLTTQMRDDEDQVGMYGTVGVWDGEIEAVIPQHMDSYYRGAILDLTADLYDEYFLTGWAGGTANDNSIELENTVIMSRDKLIEALVRARKTLTVGASAEYDTLGDALDDALDGDIIFVVPGIYTAASQFPSPLNNVTIVDRIVSISGANPDDETVVRSTVFTDFDFFLSELGADTIIEGITFDSSQMELYDASPIIRNCVFTNCNFFSIQSTHVPPIVPGTDGYSQDVIGGGALEMYQSSPKIYNCVFENNSVTGADGENGFAGGPPHPNSGDGGWPSPTYGGAVYCGLSSNPEFLNCTFTGNLAIGGNGGNGADFVVVGGAPYFGGRGGGWLYDDVNEEYLKELFPLPWDGWVFQGFDQKYEFSQYFFFMEDYDFDVWANWFSWSDQYTDWYNFFETYEEDPYDQLFDAWRYSAYGGAVYCELDSDATFENCVFEDNQTTGGLTGVGGVQSGVTVANGISWPDRRLNMPTAGGAVFAASDSDLTFINCRFWNNTAGTTIVPSPHTYQVTFGGAVAYQLNCNMTFTDCDIVDNLATVGGGIYGIDSMATVADCNIFLNEAFIGGGAFFEDEELTIMNTLIHSNIVQSPGPIEIPGENPEDPPTIVPSPFELVGEGAGVYAHVQDLEIRDSVFIDNEAEISGGGLYLAGTVDEWADIFNCLFAHNTAGRDGAGASVNWWSRAAFGNCTFADNVGLGLFEEVETGEFVIRTDPETGEPILDDDNNPIFDPVLALTKMSSSLGGGLACSYDSIVDVNDSIFWDNTADRGDGIYVGTSTDDGRPSELSVSYTTIEDYPSDRAIYLELGVQEPNVMMIFNQDPEFVTLQNTLTDSNSIKYYLDQQLSPCINTGSRLSSEAFSPSRPDERPLSDYTTSIFGALDRGVVDLGYHSRIHLNIPCSLADLVLTGDIYLEDLALFASQWLTLDNCDQGNDWCNGTDFNQDKYVDLTDFAMLSSCWLESDTEPPSPNPSQWDQLPSEVAGTFDQIKMRALEHHDQWWPDEYIEYYFDCIEPPDGPDSGWQSSRSFTVGNLAPGDYFYRCKVRDGSGIETTPSSEEKVTPGESLDLPQAVWSILPNQPVNSPTVGMQAMAYSDFEESVPLSSAYKIKYQFAELSGNQGGNGRDYSTDRNYTDSGVVSLLTYTYQVRMALVYEPGDGTSIIAKESEWSVPFDVQITEIDSEPPNDPAFAPEDPEYYVVKHEPTYPRAIASSEFPGDYEHLVVVVPMADASGLVEYRYVCYQSNGSINEELSSDWTTEVLYRVYVGGINSALKWEIHARDLFGNESVPSEQLSIVN